MSAHDNCDCPVTPHERISTAYAWIRGVMAGASVGLSVAACVTIFAGWLRPGVAVFVVASVLHFASTFWLRPRWTR